MHATLPNVMEISDVNQQLTGIFRDVFDDDSIVIKPELTADDIDEWDSVSHVRLLLTVERAFGIRFSAAEAGRLKNVGDLASLVQSKAAKT